LGDSSYEFFCQTGKDFDLRLEELGGKRLSSRIDCDLDFDEPAAEWFKNVFGALNENSGISAIATEFTLAGENAVLTGQQIYSRTNPFESEVLENLNLNGRGSNVETRHLELSLEGSNLQYEPGDCLGIYPENHPDLVDTLIDEMGWKPQDLVPVNKKGEELPLREALLRHYEVTVLTKPLLELAAQLSSSTGLRELVEPGHEQELRAYLSDRDLLDLVRDYSPWSVPAREFVSILRKMPARLYSIASSSKANPDEVHLTIRTVRYESHGRDRYGVCSIQCAERLQLGDKLPVYVHDNPNFKLPANPDTPIIMIGPGTGVAPYRSFLAEREETGAGGKTWLFYGDQHFLTDFMYQIDWQRWLNDGVLTRMDVAFSRDTDKKVYVQHRMMEKSRELFQWLEEGACVYVCGDEKHMAHDVHNTLITILQQEGGISPEEAAAYLSGMQQQKRYQRDVY
jgi:sulfite reductase (NADPH) flavoprotein alpha-component